MTPGNTVALTIWTSVGRVMSLLFNMLSRFVIAFLPRSKCLLIKFMVAVTVHSDFGAQESKICHCFHIFPLYLLWSDGTRCQDFSFFNIEFCQFFHSPLSLSSGSFFVCLHFLPLEWCHLHIWGGWHFSWQSWFQLVIYPAQGFAWCTLHIS